jgi:hypothetical protein
LVHPEFFCIKRSEYRFSHSLYATREKRTGLPVYINFVQKKRYCMLYQLYSLFAEPNVKCLFLRLLQSLPVQVPVIVVACIFFICIIPYGERYYEDQYLLTDLESLWNVHMFRTVRVPFTSRFSTYTASGSSWSFHKYEKVPR